MTMKNIPKFEEEMTFHDWSTQKSKKLLFNLLFNCPRKLSS